jgi:hypothetical protein
VQLSKLQADSHKSVSDKLHSKSEFYKQMIEEFSKNFKSVTCKPEIIENKDGENETTKYDINYVLFLC